MRTLSIAALLIAIAFHASAQDARLLPFTGVWSGTGQAREGINAPWETASCAITIEWQRGLRSNGVCEGARGRFSAGGVVNVDGNAIAGDFMAPHFIQTVSEVELSGGALISRYTFEDDGQTFSFVLTVRRVGNQLAMTTEMLLDGRYQEVGRLTLSAQ